MNARAALITGTLMCLALVRAGPCSALSLKTSVAETFMGDVMPGSKLVFSKAKGVKLRVSNSGTNATSVEFAIEIPNERRSKDGFDPWPYPETVRILGGAGDAVMSAGQHRDFDLEVAVPKMMPADGGLYEVDVVVTGRDQDGGMLPLRIRALLSVGRPPSGLIDDNVERPEFTVAPLNSVPDKVPWKSRGEDPGGGSTLKLINASDEDLTISLSPVREWDESVRMAAGVSLVPNPQWLHFEAESIKVRAGAIGRARIWASIPNQSRYVGRRFAFVAAADAVAGGRRTRRYFVYYAVLDGPEGATRAP